MLTREQIKAWLKSPTGMSRKSLAEACGVSLSCVNNWLSDSKTNPIPFAKQQLIERLYLESQPKEDGYPPTAAEITAVAIVMTQEQRKYLSSAAAQRGLSLEEFIIEAGMERAETTLSKHPSTSNGTPPDVPISLAVQLPRAVAAPRET